MSDTEINLKKIFVFWLPLAATWLMMSVEGPFLSALIARLGDPKYNLAAYGVAFSFALIIEAPVIMMMSASTALVKNYHSFTKLKNFTYLLNVSITGFMLIFLLPPVFYFITEDLIGLPERVSELTHIATIILIPWPGAIGYRRFYQGILIRNNLTRRVAYGTVMRISSMAITALLLFMSTNVDGVVVGASALSTAVILEAVASRIMAAKTIRKLKSGEIHEENFELSYREIFYFYYPLALTSLLTLGVQPLVTFFIGQSRMAIESLAVLPVIHSFVFIFRSLGLSYQEVVIALLGEKKEGYIPLRKFAFILGGLLVVILSIIAFTPLAELWLHTVSGLSGSLTEIAKVPLMIMVVFPALTVWISFQRSVLVDAKLTKSITYGTAIEFTMIIIVMMIAINLFDLIGAVAATTAFVTGRLSADAFLHFSVTRVIKRWREKFSVYFKT